MNLPEPSAGASAFPKFLDAFFAWYYQTFPVNATFIGVHDYDDRLPDLSERGIGEALAAIDTLLAQVRAFRHTTLPESQELDRRLVEGFLEIQRWEYRSAHFQAGNPCVYTGEAIFGVLALFLRPFAPLSQRVASALGRMLAIPAVLQQGRENVRRAHPAWIARARRECTGALAFFERGVPDLVRVEGIQHPRFLHAADAAADAFRAFAQHLETALPHSPPGACACGPEALDLLLREGHFLRTTPGEIEALAEDRIAAAHASLETRARSLGAGSSRGARASSANLVRVPPRSFPRGAGGGDRLRQPDRHVLRWHHGRGLGVLRHRRDGRNRVPRCVRSTCPRAHAAAHRRAGRCGRTAAHRALDTGAGRGVLPRRRGDVSGGRADCGGQEQHVPRYRADVPGGDHPAPYPHARP